MRQKFERDSVDKVARYIQDNPDGMRVLGKRIGLWRFHKLQNMLSDPPSPELEACKLFLHPDIDILLSTEAEPQKLIGVEAKVIYVGNGDRANIRFYEGLDEALALLRFGLDAVRLFQVFIVQLTDENARKRMPERWIEYQIPMRDIIRTLRLPIGYTPSLDFAVGNQLLPDPIQMIDLKDSHAARYEDKLILPPKSNPFLDSSLRYPTVIRKFLLGEYLENTMAANE